MKIKDKYLYLAGPMTGVEDLNFPAFNEATAILEEYGGKVFSPARDIDHSDIDGKPLGWFLKQELPVICDCDAVVVLPGWQTSRGARLEIMVAERLDVPVLRYPDLKPLRHPGSARFHEILREAGELHDLKQADYGSDADPFANVRTSQDWGMPAWLGAMVRATDKVKRLQTFARKGSLQNEAVVDSFMDLAVYALIARVLFEEN